MQWRVSYLLVAVIGGVAGWILKPREAVSPVVVATSHGASPRPAVLDGGELLDEFVRKQKDGQKTPNAAAKGSIADRFNELSKTLPAFIDPAADFQKLLAEFSVGQASGQPGLTPGAGVDQIATLGVLLGQWIDLDAQAAFTFVGNAYASGGGARIVANVYLEGLAAEYLEKRGLPALMDALSGSGNLVNSLAPVIFRDLGKRGSLEELEQMKEKSPAFFADYQAGQYLGKEWPVERREELLAALDPKSAAYALPGIIGRMEGSTGGEWILTKLKSRGFSQEIKDAMASGLMGSFNSNIQGVTLQQRLEIMQELGTLQRMGEDRTKNEMIFASLRGCFHSSDHKDDFLFGLRHGALTASEVVELTRDKTLDPGEHRAEYNSQMFRTLAEENLPAAMDLLAGMPAAEQKMQKADAARWWFRDTNPAEFYQLVESIDTSGDESLKTMMQDSWNDKAPANLSRFGASYLEWIRALPDGENKTRALRSVHANSGKYPKLALEAENLLKNNP